MPKLRALIVDDVVDVAQTIANDLELAGFETDVADSGAAAIERFGKEPADVVITDLRMRGGIDGLDLLDHLKRADPALPVVIMTAFGGIESAVESMQRGAYHYVAKPFELDELRGVIERACRERLLSRENAMLRRTLRDNLSSQRLLGQSAPMRQLRALIDRVAAASSPVLI
jgi:two-component system response regulator HydG